MIRYSLFTLVACAVSVSALSVPTLAQAPAIQSESPRLVTFGPLASPSEGDHDYQQFIRFSLPASAGRVFVKVFDADVAGAHDEPLGGFDTRTRFSLYGAGSNARLHRDSDGELRELMEGDPLDSFEIGRDREADNQWKNLFSVDASEGALREGRSEFVLAVEGISGNDGNVFDVAISVQEDSIAPPEDLQLYSFIPTFQAASEGTFAELRFVIPQDAKALMVENFDAAGGEIAYGGRFRSLPLDASAKSEWKSNIITLNGDEPGRAGSVTAAGGLETPNDVTLFVGVHTPGTDSAERPVAIDLPIRVFTPNQRPITAYRARQQSCGEFEFNASASLDPDGGNLTHQWQFDGNPTRVRGETATAAFEKPGLHRGRIESFDDSGMIANASALDFRFFVKPAPISHFEAPALVAQDTRVIFDGLGSSTGAKPSGNRIIRYHWQFGDGTELVQNEGDPAFGKPEHIFTTHGVFTPRLTVTDSANNPCNTAVADGIVVVNAPPIANAGGNRQALTGEILHFDGSEKSSDPDGSIAAYQWNFADERRVFYPTASHSFHQPGEYRVELTVLDDTTFSSAKDTDVVTITVKDPANERPVASAGKDRTAVVGEPVLFDGTASRDNDGTILLYDWDFGDNSGSDLPRVNHTYWAPGTYTANLTVSDNNPSDNGRSVDSVQIDVIAAQNRAPVANFATNYTASTTQPLRLDASNANDRDGAIVAYEWNFGNGKSGTGPIIEHLYSQPGIYEGNLRLIDNAIPDPAVTNVAFVVTVDHPDNLAPVADAGLDTVGLTGQIIQFDASSSTDADGSISAYTWDFGDGHTASGVKTHHIYQFPGQYDVTLKVTDDGREAVRAVGTDTLVATITRPENITPVAVAGDDVTGRRGEILRFDAARSHDPDGNILRYEWDFGDEGTSRHRQPVHAFHDPGIYVVELRVYDDGHETLTASDTLIVTVLDGSPEGNSQ